MNSVSETPACGDPLRVLFWERIGRHFENEGLDKRIDGTCKVCGSPVKGGIVSSGDPWCRPQRSITQMRHAPAEGQPVAPGVPVKMIPAKGKNGKPILVDGAPQSKPSDKNSLNGLGGIALIAPGRTFVAANVVPNGPLPPEMTAVAVRPGVQSRFWTSFLDEPPQSPFLLILWKRKAIMDLALSHSLSRTFICGEDVPQICDMTEVRRLTGIAKRVGLEAFEQACRVRAAMHRASTPEQRAKVQEMLAEVDAKTMPTSDFRKLPVPDSTAFSLVRYAMGGEDAVPGDDEATQSEAA